MFRHVPGRRFSPATLMSAAALFVALGGAGYAATGGNFVLGNPNTATSPTKLTANIVTQALQLSNTSTGAGATALGLAVASGHPALAVSSTTKIAKLNADLLDGLDSTGFQKGKGKTYANIVTVTAPSGLVTKAILDIPGFLELVGRCDPFTGLAISLRNDSPADEQVFFTDGSSTEDPPPVVTSGETRLLGVPSSSPVHDFLTVGQGLDATTHLVVIEEDHFRTSSTGCEFSAVAIERTP